MAAISLVAGYSSSARCDTGRSCVGSSAGVQIESPSQGVAICHATYPMDGPMASLMSAVAPVARSSMSVEACAFAWIIADCP